MPKLTSAFVIGAARELENDNQGRRLREVMDVKRAQNKFEYEPAVPENITRRYDPVIMNSASVVDLPQILKGDISSYVTSVSVAADDSDEKKAGEAEKLYAVARTRNDPGGLSDDLALFDVLVLGMTVRRLVCGDPSSDWPWRYETEDIFGCFYPEAPYPARPPQIARRYRKLVRDLMLGDEFINYRDGTRPKYDDRTDTWDLDDYVSEDVATWRSGPTALTAVKGSSKLVECVQFEDTIGGKTYTWDVVLNGGKVDGQIPKDSTGQIISERENLTGGSAYVIVPGATTSIRQMYARYTSFLNASQEAAAQVSSIRTIRASRAAYADPQLLVQRDPEVLKALQAWGFARPTDRQDIELTGSNSIVEVDGKMFQVTLPDTADLDKLEQRVQQDYDNASATQLSVSSAEVLKQSTRGGLQLALGVRSRRQSQLLTFLDIGHSELLKMWRSTVVCDGGYGDIKPKGYRGRAQGGERYGKMGKGGEVPAGSTLVVTKDKLDGFDHDIRVTTASHTSEEERYALELGMAEVQAGVGTMDDVIDGLFPDGYGQRQKLAREGAYKVSAAKLEPLIGLTVDQIALEKYGVMLNQIGQPPGPSPLTLNTPSNTGAGEQVPQTEGVTGGSAPGVQGAGMATAPG